jgi:hypothetical protein
LSYSENEGQFLEGTGSMVIDYQSNIIYACLSPRTNSELVTKLGELTGYQVIRFHSSDHQGKAVYHTNVMMCIGDHFAVICEESIQNENERQTVLNQLRKSNKVIIPISLEQMNFFAGNMYQAFNRLGEPKIIMSEQAFQSLTPAQLTELENHGKIISVPLYTIEKFGGGSARCMITDIR